MWIVELMRYPTDRQTNRQTDIASYRGALSHLKRKRKRRRRKRRRARKKRKRSKEKMKKAGFTDTPVTCGWAGAISKVTRPFG